ncbi:MAG: anthranilate synthase component I family protein [Polyangiaceae bacterium]
MVRRVALPVLDADPSDPLALYRRLRAAGGHGFLFESREGASRCSFLGVGPRAIHRFRAGSKADPLRFMERFVGSRAVAPSDAALPSFAGGLVGFLSFECVGRVEPRLATSARDELGFPEALLMDFDAIVALEPARREPLVIVEARTERGGDERATLDEARARGGDRGALRRDVPEVGAPRLGLGPTVARTPQRAFVDAVRRAKRHIARGDCQQIVLAKRFDRAGAVDPVAAFGALRAINPSPYLFLVEAGPLALVGSSPETLVRVRGSRGGVREVVLKPIAGTRRRGADEVEDARLERELRGDEKENAEHSMLLDLGRNDVGRVAAYGTVEVVRRAAVERYSHVMHLVSEVRGVLAPGLTEVDALRAAFPAGTLSGAPKVRAIEILRALEPCARGAYGGAVGFVDSAGALDLAITIRTLVVSRGRVSAQAGAGVVHDSSPTAELEETHHKARAVLRAAEIAGGDHV